MSSDNKYSSVFGEGLPEIREDTRRRKLPSPFASQLPHPRRTHQSVCHLGDALGSKIHLPSLCPDPETVVRPQRDSSRENS